MLAILKALIRKGYKMKSQNRKVSRKYIKVESVGRTRHILINPILLEMVA
jgi:hypothetical protein